MRGQPALVNCLEMWKAMNVADATEHYAGALVVVYVIHILYSPEKFWEHPLSNIREYAFKGVLHRLPQKTIKWACAVICLKIISIFLKKKNICIL